MSINLKRAYDAPATSDGYRILVDRIWPRGIVKDGLGQFPRSSGVLR